MAYTRKNTPQAFIELHGLTEKYNEWIKEMTKERLHNKYKRNYDAGYYEEYRKKNKAKIALNRRKGYLKRTEGKVKRINKKPKLLKEDYFGNQ